MTRTNQKPAAEMLRGAVVPSFENPKHKEALLHELLAQRVRESAAEAESSGNAVFAPSRWGMKWALGTAGVGMALVVAFFGITFLSKPTTVFARALSVFQKYPVIHYVLSKRAMQNQWGPVVDPRHPLVENDEVWIHRDDQGNPVSVRYDSGKESGDYHTYRISYTEPRLINYAPKSQMAWRKNVAPTWMLELGPFSVLQRVADLDDVEVELEETEEQILASVQLPARPLPSDRNVPVVIEEFETRQSFLFDRRTGQLQEVTIKGKWDNEWVKLMEIRGVEYLQYDPTTFELNLDEEVAWGDEPVEIKGTELEQVVAKKPEAVAKEFFAAWINEDYETLRIYAPHSRAALKRDRQNRPYPIEVLEIGTAERSDDGVYPGVFVPYRVRLNNGQVKEWRLALKQRKDGTTWYVDGGF